MGLPIGPPRATFQGLESGTGGTSRPWKQAAASGPQPRRGACLTRPAGWHECVKTRGSADGAPGLPPTQNREEPIKCRLCGGNAVYMFSKIFYEKYSVGYYQCMSCCSLQSEMPYWLDEAYADISLIPDIRTLQRVLAMRRLVFFLSKILHFSEKDPILDWGEGEMEFLFDFCVMWD